MRDSEGDGPWRMDAGPAGTRPPFKAGGSPQEPGEESRPLGPAEEHGPPDALISDFASLQNRERMNFCGLKPSVSNHFSQQPLELRQQGGRFWPPPCRAGPTGSLQPDQARALNERFPGSAMGPKPGHACVCATGKKVSQCPHVQGTPSKAGGD